MTYLAEDGDFSPLWLELTSRYPSLHSHYGQLGYPDRNKSLNRWTLVRLTQRRAGEEERERENEEPDVQAQLLKMWCNRQGRQPALWMSVKLIKSHTMLGVVHNRGGWMIKNTWFHWPVSTYVASWHPQAPKRWTLYHHRSSFIILIPKI